LAWVLVRAIGELAVDPPGGERLGDLGHVCLPVITAYGPDPMADKRNPSQIAHRFALRFADASGTVLGQPDPSSGRPVADGHINIKGLWTVWSHRAPDWANVNR